MVYEPITINVKTTYMANLNRNEYAELKVTNSSVDENDLVHIWTTDNDVNVDSLASSASAFTGIVNGKTVPIFNVSLMLEFDYRNDEDGHWRSRELQNTIDHYQNKNSVRTFKEFENGFDRSYMNTGNGPDYGAWLNIMLTAARLIEQQEGNPNARQLITFSQADDDLTTRSKTRLVDAMGTLCQRTGSMMIMSTLDPYVISSVHAKSVHVFHEDGIHYDENGHRINEQNDKRSISVHSPIVETYHEDISVISNKVLGITRLDSGPER